MFKTFFRFVFFCLALVIIPTAYACDPFACMLGGHEQDTLLLGEIVESKEELQTIKVTYLFPQNKIPSLKTGDLIIVKNFNTALNRNSTELINVGNQYLMSLNQNDSFYTPHWGIFEIIGTNYKNAKLVKNNSIEDEALEIFIHSGGTEKDFGFDYSGYKPILILNGIRQESNKLLWSTIGISSFIFLSIFYLYTKKHK